MAALAAVPTGKNLNDVISMPAGRGETVVLLHALNDAVAYLGDEYFDPDGLALYGTLSWFGNRSADVEQGVELKAATRGAALDAKLAPLPYTADNRGRRPRHG